MSNNTKHDIEAEATQIRQNYNFRDCEIDLFKLGDDLGIEIKTESKKTSGISGALIRYGNNFLIYYASSINNIAYQRFSIAHEFGHYFLPAHPENIFKDGFHYSHAGTGSKDRYEREADYFSTCLLMPKFLFQQEMYKYNDGMEAIKNLANIFNTSLTSTAIRYIELIEIPAMLVISKNNIIDAVFMTKELRKFGKNIYVKNNILPTRDICSTEQTKREILLNSWIHTNHQIKAIEESIFLGSYEKTLTVITTPILYKEIEEKTNSSLWIPPYF
ncbi:ImmA/IrrE family metallo-endopeptidase [Acinetobacter baumannii]|uniref:ImmA/IrrE family metallo-endopeptidase n=1 Tax=Acinetobacter baumannii TaxID=470 RepID=UPI002957F07D|nr:ImmA/IrrE family metallo-endopeptidase [Acinetobacter baumannii]HEN9551143.1 ImmA/IrrE family metallo-endopeptidase [Acinetobacter baumannii]